MQKSQDGQGFLQAGRAAPWDFPWASPSGNPGDEPCQPSESHGHPPPFLLGLTQYQQYSLQQQVLAERADLYGNRFFVVVQF